MEQAPRQEEHRRFLEWVLQRCGERAVDALVVSGDVFHYMQPSAAAQKDLYSFIARAAAETPLQTIVLVAGNHDSPTRFDAPREVLEALDVRVVGVLPDDEELERCLVPIRNDADDVEAVVAAVPYVSEARLGVSTTQASPAEVAGRYERAFRQLYADLAALARERHGDDVALIATGHLTCVAGDDETRVGDFQTPIHQFVASDGRGLPTDIFDAYDYAALGHVHRFHQVGESVAWYPGSPVPTNVIESRTPRYVIETDFEDGACKHVRPARLPRWREVYELVGFEDEILELLKGLSWDSELAPYLYVERLVTTPTRAGVDRFQNFVTQHFSEPRPRIVGFRKNLVTDEETRQQPETETTGPTSLDDATPEEVFAQMYRLKYENEPTDEIMVAFRSLLVPDEVEDAEAVAPESDQLDLSGASTEGAP
jgi:exonuclease SbcD